MQILSNPVFQTILSGVFVFISGETIQRFILDPLKDFKKTIGKIDNKLKFHSNIITSPKLAGDLAPELYKVLRELSCDLESAYKQIPFKTLFRLICILPKHKNVSEAAKKLIFLSNSVNKNGIPRENDAALEEIRENLGSPSLK
ncbi:MAG TPA: hypothetical protein DCS63_08585 [Elusimicrobia bacterium]|nr:hypothetical protein [Elusimicrobiota bacterium]